MDALIVLAVITFLMILWSMSGLILHHFFHAKKESDYHPLGYILSVFPGPFVPLVLWFDDQGNPKLYR